MPIQPSMFLTNHALVLIQIWREPYLTIRAIAERVGITERATHRILKALSDRGCIEARREGRRNRYLVLGDMQMRHPLLAEHQIIELLQALGGERGVHADSAQR